MADKTILQLTEQNPAKTTDWIYIVDETQSGELQNRKVRASTLLATATTAVLAVPTMSDGNLYVMWEKGTTWTITRLSDGFYATITNNPTKTTATLAWTDRATLTYSATGA